MNSSNPFQLPACLERMDSETRRRERFRRIVVATVAAIATLLIAMLIQGCVGEHAKTTGSPPVKEHPTFAKS